MPAGKAGGKLRKGLSSRGPFLSYSRAPGNCSYSKLNAAGVPQT